MISYHLEKLQVTNFRNLENEIVSFSSGINCIFGENGNGKTNLLEAIYVLSTRKSFRKNTGFPQFLSIDGEKPEIIFSSVFNSSDNQKISYSAKLEHGQGQYFIDGKPVKKRPDFKLVFINPFDSYSFHNLASFRRAWFDQYIGQLNPIYKKALNKYNSSLKFRNTLLGKKPYEYQNQIVAIDQELSRLSVFLTSERIHFLSEISPYCSETFGKIFSEEHEIEIKLDTRLLQLDEKWVLNMFKERWPKDDAAGFTTYGVHKDDYTLLFDGMNAYEFCSLGQQKMSYLSLLFAYISLFGYKYRSFPIVLIDDVSGELDRLRWKRLIEYLKEGNFQVVITTANDKFKEELEKIKQANKIYVDGGALIQNPE